MVRVEYPFSLFSIFITQKKSIINSIILLVLLNGTQCVLMSIEFPIGYWEILHERIHFF